MFPASRYILAELIRECLKPSKMADDEVLDINGKLIYDLRVTDLKKELDKRSLSKSGNKKELVERLKAVGI